MCRQAFTLHCEVLQRLLIVSKLSNIVQVCIVDFSHNKLIARAHASDPSLGGRDLDAVLLMHF